MIPSDHVLKICRFGQADDQCRYLGQVPGSHGQFICGKVSPMIKLRVDDQVSNGSTKITGRGDNCAGHQ